MNPEDIGEEQTLHNVGIDVLCGVGRIKGAGARFEPPPRRAVIESDLVRAIGGTFHAGDVTAIGVRPDIVIECTGYGPLVFELTDVVANDAVICLAGISASTREVKIGLDEVNKQMVLENIVLFGSVNAARRHYEQAAASLAKADLDWLTKLVSRKVPLSDYTQALRRLDDDVKVAIDLRH